MLAHGSEQGHTRKNADGAMSTIEDGSTESMLQQEQCASSNNVSGRYGYDRGCFEQKYRWALWA